MQCAAHAALGSTMRTAAPPSWRGAGHQSSLQRQAVVLAAKSVRKPKGSAAEPPEISDAGVEIAKPKKTRAPRKTAAKKKAPAADEDDELDGTIPLVDTFNIPQRHMSIDSSQLPWGKAKPAGAVAAAVAVPKSRREERDKVVPMSQRLKMEVEALESRIKKYDAQGNLSYDRSILGEGKMHTYALAVYGGKENRYCEFMQYKLMEMGTMVDPETGEVVPRKVEFSTPTKMIKTFSEKSLKWSNKAIGYKQGGWVLMRAVLDEQLVQQVSSMIYFQYWRDVMNFTLAGSEEPIVVPKPCTPEQLADVEAWLLHTDEEEDELVKCEEYGGEVDLEIAAKVMRRDEMPEDLDVNEEGQTIYKRDYTGTYVNPNNFYEGDDDRGLSTGAASAADRGAGRGRGGEASGASSSRSSRSFGQEGAGYQQARGRPQQDSGYGWDEQPARSSDGGWRQGGARDLDGPAVDKASFGWEQDDWGSADRQQWGGGTDGDGGDGFGREGRGRGSSSRERDGGRQQRMGGGRFADDGYQGSSSQERDGGRQQRTGGGRFADDGYQGSSSQERDGGRQQRTGGGRFADDGYQGSEPAWGGYDRPAPADEGGRGRGRGGGRGGDDFYEPGNAPPVGQGWMAGGDELGLADDWGMAWEQGAAQPSGRPADREGRGDQSRRGRGGRGGGRGRSSGGRPSYDRDQGY